MTINKEFWKGKRVLVTEHTGFKGRWLCLWLSEMGAEITGISLAPNTIPSLYSQVEIEKRLKKNYTGDIRNLKSIQEIIKQTKPEIVFHLAVQALVRESYLNPLGTWPTNVQGSLNTLESLKNLRQKCAIAMITTDKVYENNEWIYGYRENDRLGGHDPYSASKAAAELAISSWRRSFCGEGEHQTSYLSDATARAGNVIGGGDWSTDRIIPDAMRALESGQVIRIRNQSATRPWQHVLKSLSGYLYLAEALTNKKDGDWLGEKVCSSFNFGPNLEANRTVKELIEGTLLHWRGSWKDISNKKDLHEATKHQLNTEKAQQILRWKPIWDFETTIRRTVLWYKIQEKDKSPQKTA